MVARSVRLGSLVAVTAATMALLSSPAHADYAPGAGDVVGVGSDTLQQLVDFVADGDPFGGSGYNQLGNPNKFISIDATADANTRLAYGSGGVNGLPGSASTTSLCAPGTGGTAGTGNQNTTHNESGQPCTLNPTVVLRQGLPPTQRPNGSGAGYNLLVADTNQTGTNAGSGKGLIDFSRASSAKNANNAFFDSITVGTDPLAMLSSTNTNAVALSAAQLNLIYSCTDTTWNQVGGTSTATIVPLLPQVGSGTRSSFLKAINNPTLGSCVKNVEENDPEAIDASGDPTNAIEPMSGGRLNLFQGKSATGTSQGSFFFDPSCPFPPFESSTPAACTGTAPAESPNVKLWSSGAPSDSNPVLNVTRNLYIYFRHADINSATPFQPGSTLNWVRTMLYNPCSGTGHTVGCVTIGGVQYGPGGQPYFATSAGQGEIAKSGITPTYAYTAAAP